MRRGKGALRHPVGLSVSLFMILPLWFLLFSTPAFSKTEEKSQCIACHTNARKLLEITRIIRQTTPKPQKSLLTKGEG